MATLPSTFIATNRGRGRLSRRRWLGRYYFVTTKARAAFTMRDGTIDQRPHGRVPPLRRRLTCL